MFRLSGVPASKPDKQFPKGQHGPLFFMDGEKATALAMAEGFHNRGYKVRLVTYGDGKFRALFDSKNRGRKPRKLAA